MNRLSFLLRGLLICAAPLTCLSYVALTAQDTPAQAPVGTGLQTAFDERGLIALRYGGATLTDVNADGAQAFSVAGVSGLDENGKIVDIPLGTPRRIWDDATKTLTLDYSWGRVSCRYAATPDGLDLDIGILNRSNQTLAGANIFPLGVRFGGFPQGFDGTTPHVGFNSDGPTVQNADFGAGVLTVVNREIDKPLAVGFLTTNQTAQTFGYGIYVGSAPLSYQPGNWPRFTRPIAPGASDRYAISLRLTPRGGDVYQSASDVYQKFAAAHPLQVKWDDRRSIGALFLSSSPSPIHPLDNPRGWFNNAADVDVNSDQGREDFRARVLNYARDSARILKENGAQGMITWDIEGQEYPHSTSYIGDPRLMPTLAPEMESVADAYFKVFTDAGLRVGICVRPQQLNLAGADDKQDDVADEAAQLNAKIAYARKRWNCTLFYVDSNGDPNLPSDATIFARVLADNPGILLMPEHQNFKYQVYSAPYNDLRFESSITPDAVRRTYPRAFSVMKGEMPQLIARRDELVRAVRAGDVLMFNAWYENDEADAVKSIYAQARGK